MTEEEKKEMEENFLKKDRDDESELTLTGPVSNGSGDDIKKDRSMLDDKGGSSGDDVDDATESADTSEEVDKRIDQELKTAEAKLSKVDKRAAKRKSKRRKGKLKGKSAKRGKPKVKVPFSSDGDETLITGEDIIQANTEFYEYGDDNDLKSLDAREATKRGNLMVWIILFLLTCSNIVTICVYLLVNILIADKLYHDDLIRIIASSIINSLFISCSLNAVVLPYVGITICIRVRQKKSLC